MKNVVIELEQKVITSMCKKYENYSDPKALKCQFVTKDNLVHFHYFIYFKVNNTKLT